MTDESTIRNACQSLSESSGASIFIIAFLKVFFDISINMQFIIGHIALILIFLKLQKNRKATA